jgi:AMMECR1 domain-containing protein
MTREPDERGESSDQWWKLLQARRDLLVTRRTTNDPKPWIVARRDNAKQYALSEDQFEILRALADGPDGTDLVSKHLTATDEDPLAQLEQLMHNLVQIQLVEPASCSPSTVIPTPPRWTDPARLARWAILTYAKTSRWPVVRSSVARQLAVPRGCYVCLKREGLLRGCFGSITPRFQRLADDIAQNAMAAACWDYRFKPVEADEVDHLSISVDLVDGVEFVNWPADADRDWDPQVYGIQLRHGSHTVATLLPGLEGVHSAAEQFEFGLGKAGISESDDLVVVRFKTTRLPDAVLIPLNPYESALATSA